MTFLTLGLGQPQTEIHNRPHRRRRPECIGQLAYRDERRVVGDASCIG